MLHARLVGLREAITGGASSWRTTALFMAAFLVVLTISFMRNQHCIFNGLDGTSWRVMLAAQAVNHTPFSATGVDPYQGSFDANYPVFREYLAPGAIAMLLRRASLDPAAVYSVYAACLMLATFLLASVVGFDRPTALLGSFLMPLLSLPTVSHSWGLLYALFAFNPHIAQIVAISLLIVAAFWALDARSVLLRAVLFVAPTLCLMLAILGLAPYVSLMVPATALYGGASFLAVRRWRDDLPRLAAGLLIIAVPLALGVLTFYRGLIGYTAYDFFSGEFEQTRSSLLYVSTFFWINSFGWLTITLGILGAVWLLVSATGKLRALAATHLVATVVYFAAATYIVEFATTYQGPSPVYFETCMWAYSLLFASAALTDIVRLAVLALRRWCPEPLRSATTYLGNATIIVALLIVITVGANADPSAHDECAHNGFAPVRPTPITEVLRKNIALAAGQPFRGIVATFDGIASHAPTDWFQLYEYDKALWGTTGNDHRAAGLWYFGIPTLFQYFSTITPPYYLLLTDFLAHRTDHQIRSVVVLTHIDPAALQLWGVRYVITDMDPAAGTEVAAIDLPDHRRLRLMELPKPNLGTYSPTNIVKIDSFLAALAAMHATDFDGSQTVLTDAAETGSLVPATNAELVYERYGFHITADSTARSVLVLPAQYSHCWSVQGTGNPTMFRADIMQLGIAFEGHLDARLVFTFGPVLAGSCRLEDIADMKRLSIAQARAKP